MRRLSYLIILIAFIVSCSPLANGQADREVVRAFDSGFNTAEEFRKLHRFVLASEKESRWRQIPWLNSIWDAMEASKVNGKPMFIWAMNGDPLGCV